MLGIRFQYLPVVEMVDFLPKLANGASMMTLCGDFSLTTGRRVSEGELDEPDDLWWPKTEPLKMGHESLTGKIFHLKRN